MCLTPEVALTSKAMPFVFDRFLSKLSDYMIIAYSMPQCEERDEHDVHSVVRGLFGTRPFDGPANA